MGHLHYLGLREAVLLGDFLTDVFEQRNHGVEGGAVSDQLRVSLALLPLLSHGLHGLRLLGLGGLQAALLDRGVLNCVLETVNLVVSSQYSPCSCPRTQS